MHRGLYRGGSVYRAGRTCRQYQGSVHTDALGTYRSRIGTNLACIPSKEYRAHFLGKTELTSVHTEQCTEVSR
jgi:hypothetical protein